MQYGDDSAAIEYRLALARSCAYREVRQALRSDFQNRLAFTHFLLKRSSATGLPDVMPGRSERAAQRLLISRTPKSRGVVPEAWHIVRRANAQYDQIHGMLSDIPE